MIPLILKIKKGTHKDIAQAQDIIVQELYDIFESAVFHGGTAIWRCYGGNRFSEDLDFYLPREKLKIDSLFTRLQDLGFSVQKKKLSERSLYSELAWNRTSVRLEAIFKKTEGHLKEYQTVDGNFLTVYTLLPEEFIAEKVQAYLGRRKVRDLYDIFFLMRFVTNRAAVKPHILRLQKEFNPPVDEKELIVLILEGLVPTSDKIAEYLWSLTWEK